METYTRVIFGFVLIHVVLLLVYNSNLIGPIYQHRHILHFVIPCYRGQSQHYQTFIQHLNMAARKNWDIRVFVVKQNDDQQLKRGWLLNIGILKSVEYEKADCIITQDFDHAINVNIDYSWCDEPTEISLDHTGTNNETSRKIWRAKPEHWLHINGYRNAMMTSEEENYDMLHRFRTNYLKPSYDRLRQLSIGMETTVKRMKIMEETKKQGEWKSDGLSNTKYFITKRLTDAVGTTWFKVSDIPDISKQEIKKLKRGFSSSPVVVPKYKLIFFWNEKSGCTYWKRVLQYIQGIDLKNITNSIHDPKKNGLLYLSGFHDTDVIRMMYDDSWIKAVFVREPRERILSAYLNKGHSKRFTCNRIITSFGDFLKWIRICPNPHWESQVRIPRHYYTMMMTGKMVDISSFTELLLKQIGAWNDDVEKWLSSNDLNKTRSHATQAKDNILKYYNPQFERQILDMYKDDYEVFGYNKTTYTK